jgi:predicted DNA-binding ribbon-helix-helix protein
MAHLRQRSPNIPVSKRSTKRSITIADHKTSVSLENEFWDCLREIAGERGVSLGALVAAIDANRQNPNLSAQLSEFLCLSFIVMSLVYRRFPGPAKRLSKKRESRFR